MSRNIVFDQLKGILIILVIIGHVALGEIKENPLREFLYFFHMPIFLAITGYFISQSTLNLPYKEIIKKYKNRLITPYLLAFIFYTTLLIIFKTNSLKQFIALFLYPFYHLWYIPAMFIFIFYLKAISKIKTPWSYIFIPIIFLLFTIMTAYFETYYHENLISQNNIFKLFYSAIGDKRFYGYFLYFAFGYFISSNKHITNKNKLLTTAIYILLGIAGTIGNIYIRDDTIIHGFFKLLTNLSLIGLLISLAAQQSSRNTGRIGKLIAQIGIISLPIYLWHQFPIMVMKKIHISNNGLYTISFIFFIFFILLAIKLEDKHPLINKYFYGKK